MVVRVRKWGLIAVAFVDAVASIVAFTVMFGPGEGSTEFHQREYVAAINELHGYTYLDRLRRLRSWITGSPIEPMADERKQRLREQTKRHQTALLETGFLVEREIPIKSGMEITPAVIQLNKQPKNKDPYTRGILKTLPGNNRFAVVVIATTNDVRKWEELIRKADGREQRN